MEKKQYIEPRMNVRSVLIDSLMQGSTVHDEIGGGDNFSKDTDVSENEGNISSHDIWED